MIVVDSSIWISFFRAVETPATLFLKTTRDKGNIIVGDLVLLEILQGTISEKHSKFIEARLRKFVVRPMLSPRLAVAAARNYRFLRGKGITIRKTQDLIIGTFCIEEGHSLLHDDRDFVPMSQHLGLRIAVP